MENVWLKVILVIIVFFVSVGSGYLAFRSGGKEDGNLNCYLCNIPLGFAECFGAGIFLGAGLIHMLGDAQRVFIASGQEYPTPLVVCGGVFLGFLMIEQYAARLAADSHTNDTSSHSNSNSNSNSSVNSNNKDSQANGSEEIDSSQSSNEGLDITTDSPRSEEDIELTESPTGQNNPVLFQDQEGQSSELRKPKKLMSQEDKVLPLSVLVLLSIHSVLMGAAFGITSSVASTCVIFIAVIAHKGSASFALALELTNSTFTRSFAWKLFLVFTLMFPLGALLGGILSNILDDHPLYEATFSAIAAGTFLFFGTVHGLSNSALVDKCQNFKYFCGVVVGFTVMAIVAIYL